MSKKQRSQIPIQIRQRKMMIYQNLTGLTMEKRLTKRVQHSPLRFIDRGFYPFLACRSVKSMVEVLASKAQPQKINYLQLYVNQNLSKLMTHLMRTQLDQMWSFGTKRTKLWILYLQHATKMTEIKILWVPTLTWHFLKSRPIFSHQWVRITIAKSWQNRFKTIWIVNKIPWNTKKSRKKPYMHKLIKDCMGRVSKRYQKGPFLLTPNTQKRAYLAYSWTSKNS